MKKACAMALTALLAMNMIAFANGTQDDVKTNGTTDSPVVQTPTAPVTPPVVQKPSGGCGCGKGRSSVQAPSRRSCKPR
jgi:hypothetical protein